MYTKTRHIAECSNKKSRPILLQSPGVHLASATPVHNCPVKVSIENVFHSMQQPTKLTFHGDWCWS